MRCRHELAELENVEASGALHRFATSDLGAWELLRDRAIPALLAEREPGATIRAWVAGCSTGEEAYTLAMVFQEALDQIEPSKAFPLQVFATDLDKDAIDAARRGVYAAEVVASLSPERRDRFFTARNGAYVVNGDIREVVTFAPQDLVMHPPFARLDIVSCRNVLMYFSSSLQQRVLPLFHYGLRPGGVLLLGSAETTGASASLFTSIDDQSRLYRRADVARPESLDFPGMCPPARRPHEAGVARNVQELVDRLLLERFAPPTVLTNRDGDIVYVSGRTGRYLEPASGKANWNIRSMARDELRYAIKTALSRAVDEQGPVTIQAVRVVSHEGSQLVDIVAEPIGEPEGWVMISFVERAPTAAAPAELSDADPTAAALLRSHDELQLARNEAQSLRDQMWFSREELTASNEGRQTANEQLQSANEEIIASKEELYAVNDEVLSLNGELRAKVDDLSQANNDIRNLLDSTDVATLFLDTGLNIRRFTARMSKLIDVLPADRGRPVTDLASKLIYPELAGDARSVLATRGTKERSVAIGDGRWFTVRLMPYRTLDNRIDGVVITFTDSTVAGQLEGAAADTHT